MQALRVIEKMDSKIFKRNKVSLEIKILAIALFLHGLGVRRISQITEKSKSSVHEWTLKFREGINYNPLKRKCIAIDETKIKVNNEWYFIYAAIDNDTKELICMKVYTARNYLTTLLSMF